jgi:glyoxylase-like metal-dependent hydrolase (beta-lactamase superfamily II)
MRIRLGFLCAFTLLLLAAARSQTSAARELAPGVFFWQGDHVKGVPANGVWVVFKDYVLVVDANFPQGAQEILPLIRQSTPKPIRFLFDTHWHGDHTGANKVYAEAGATIVCSTACAEELRTKGAKARAPAEPASMSFSDRMVFDDGAKRVELIRLGPAHSKGDAVAYLPKERILVAGDLCVNWNWGNNVGDPDADYDGWLRALDELTRWDIQTLIPGHGAPGATETLRGQRAYLADMREQVRAGVKAGKTADQLVKAIDLSKHGSWGGNQDQNANSIRAMTRNKLL